MTAKQIDEKKEGAEVKKNERERNVGERNGEASRGEIKEEEAERGR